MLPENMKIDGVALSNVKEMKYVEKVNNGNEMSEITN